MSSGEEGDIPRIGAGRAEGLFLPPDDFEFETSSHSPFSATADLEFDEESLSLGSDEYTEVIVSLPPDRNAAQGVGPGRVPLRGVRVGEPPMIDLGDGDEDGVTGKPRQRIEGPSHGDSQSQGPSRRALLKQAGRWRVSGDLTTIVHGNLDNLPATLVVLRLRVAFAPRSTLRISSAQVQVQVSPVGGVGRRPKKMTAAARELRALGFPRVEAVAPSHWKGETLKVQVSQKTTIGATLSLAPVQLPIPVGPSVDLKTEHAKTMTFARDFSTEIIGTAWTSDDIFGAGLGDGIDDAATWDVLENDVLKEGIPREMRLAVVIRRGASVEGGPLGFEFTVKTKLKTAMGFGLFGKLWSSDKPLVIDSESEFVEKGQHRRGMDINQDFGSLTGEEWGHLVGS